MKHYKAPWSVSLVISSCLVTVFCLGITLCMICFGRGIVPWVALLPVAAVAGAAPFTIRGYTITSDAILVHRLFWATQLPVDGLEAAQFEPDAMRWSLRTFGNGGLFSITGFFRNKRLGAYRAFVTDQHRTVVLRYSERTVVVSPADPEAFVNDLAASSRRA